MTTPAPLLVIQHEDEDPIGLLGERLTQLGVTLDIRRGHDGHDIPTALEATATHRGVIVLGGYMGADDDDEHGWLTATKSLLRDLTQSAAVPVLGICLGHQLLASALGGRVGRNPAGRALGLTPVTLTAAGGEDPLLSGYDGTEALQYNDDVILDLPPGATVLARTSDGAPQAVRFGPRSWGVQFHPEVEAAVFATWSGVPQPIIDATYAAEPALRHTWLPLADRFLALTTSLP